MQHFLQIRQRLFQTKLLHSVSILSTMKKEVVTKKRPSKKQRGETYFLKRYKDVEDQQVLVSAIKYIENLLLATGFEKKEILQRERMLRESLTVQELELRGLAIRDLRIDSEFFVPCCERVNVEMRFVKDGASISGGITWKSGTLVTLQYSTDQQFEQLDSWQTVKGIVSNITSQTINVRFANLESFLLEGLLHGNLPGNLRIIKRSEGQLYRNQAHHLKEMIKYELNTSPASPIGNIYSLMFSAQEETTINQKDHILTIYDKQIEKDKSKLKALELCSRCPPLFLVHGPPGTGKTTTLAAAVLSAVANGEKVLVAAPSHAACDAFTMAIANQWPRGSKPNILRLGSTLRFTNKLVKLYSVAETPEMENIGEKLAFTRRQMLDNNKGKKALFKEEKHILSEYWRLNNDSVEEAISAASVVITTVTHALMYSTSRVRKQLREKTFDLVVIDEAGFTPATTVLPLISLAPRLILAGDHHQLPPVVLTEEAKQLGLQQSIFEILAGRMQKNVCLLDTQYRSHKAIAGWSSKYFYQDRLKSAAGVCGILVQDLIPKTQNKRRSPDYILTSSPIMFVDTKGLKWHEEMEDEESISNSDEAVLVAELVEKYISLGIQQQHLAVIAPYWAQISLIRSLVWEGAGLEDIDIRTVDGFQGREKEIVIISLVRSNEMGEVGFLAETRRINVSVTRAKRACVIIGDSGTLMNDTGLASLLQYCGDQSAVYSAEQFHQLVYNIN